MPLEAARVMAIGERLIFGYHLLLRRSLNRLVRELGLNWQPMAGDGSCEGGA